MKLNSELQFPSKDVSKSDLKKTLTIPISYLEMGK